MINSLSYSMQPAFFMLLYGAVTWLKTLQDASNVHCVTSFNIDLFLYLCLSSLSCDDFHVVRHSITLDNNHYITRRFNGGRHQWWELYRAVKCGQTGRGQIKCYNNTRPDKWPKNTKLGSQYHSINCYTTTTCPEMAKKLKCCLTTTSNEKLGNSRA